MSSKSSSKNRRVKQRKQFNSEIQPRFWSCKKCSILISIIVLCVAYSVLQFQPRGISMSDMLQAQIDSGQRALDLQQQLVSHLETPVPEMIKAKLKPVLHKLSSIRTQIHQYEEMEKIPGGPAHFIASTSAELDLLENRDLLSIRAEVYDLITLNGNAGLEFMKTDRQVRAAEVYAIKVTDLSVLANQGIKIGPNQYEGQEDPPDFVETVGKGLNLSHVLDVYRNLTGIYKVLEDTFDEMNRLATERGIEDFASYIQTKNKSDPNDALVSAARRLVKYEKASQREILKNQDKYKLLLPFKIMVHKNIVELNQRIGNFEQEINGQSITLMRMAGTEITKLRARLENLKHKYLKITVSEYVYSI